MHKMALLVSLMGITMVSHASPRKSKIHKSDVVKTTILLKESALCRMTRSIIRIKGLSFEQASEVSAYLIRHHDHGRDIGQETADAFRDRAWDSAIDGAIDSLKIIDSVVDLHPGDCAEHSRDAYNELSSAWNDYSTASEIQGHLDSGRWELAGDSGVFVGPDYGK